MAKKPLDQIREIVAEFPEMEERLSHGSPSFFIRGKKTLCSYHEYHHGSDRIALWFPAQPGVQEELVSTEPERFFKPPYVGPSGWVGVFLDGTGENAPDWDEVTEMLKESYRKVGPKKLIAILDAELDDRAG